MVIYHPLTLIMIHSVIYQHLEDIIGEVQIVINSVNYHILAVRKAQDYLIKIVMEYMVLIQKVRCGKMNYVHKEKDLVLL